MARTGFIQNELDLKLLVLYIMSRTAAPVTFNQLLDVALCDAGVDYFSLTEVVGHLVETGHLEQTGQVYAITEKGRRNSEICESSLPYSVRMHCDENLGKLNGALKRAAQVQTGVEPHPDGTCTVRLFFADDGGPLVAVLEQLPDHRAGGAQPKHAFGNHDTKPPGNQNLPILQPRAEKGPPAAGRIWSYYSTTV